ncbi:MAG TPA: cation:proton antiporter [Pirellulales bacterium]|jgi:Kef-type K+ transport system membrane component KefB|nr:cation:proton antiporter [Pirellulales bacterium]
MHYAPAGLLANRFPAAAAYAAMLVGAVGAFLAIDHWGASLEAPALTAPTAAHARHAPAAQHGDIVFHVLLALAAVIVTGRLLSKLFARFQQPPVIGEVIAGILLGPSLLGRLSPELSAYVLPQSAAPYLGIVAQLGVILYMFLVGLELNAGLLRDRAHATVAISHASIVLPFLLGAVLALALYPRLSTSDVRFTSFALFLGVAMSITAFPVLARILTDRRMTKTDLGVVALSCAATDDVTAWCLLALVVGVAQAKIGAALFVISAALAYIAVMFIVVRPIVTRLAQRYQGTQLTPAATAVVLVGVLASALATQWIGIHAIFGAFLLGAMIPHDSVIARELTRKLEDLVTILLLPAFFAFTGMRTQIGLVSGPEAWLICGVVILVATLGKFGGTVGAARLTGIGWRDSAALGVLMNTRGLMELIVLNIGLDMGVISPTLFAMLVLMAIVTTMATTPVLSWLVPDHRRGLEAAR